MRGESTHKLPEVPTIQSYQKTDTNKITYCLQSQSICFTLQFCGDALYSTSVHDREPWQPSSGL